MKILEGIFNSWYPPVLTLIIFYLLYLAVSKILERQAKGKTDKGLIKSIVLFSIALLGIISVVLALPLGEQKEQITSLIGIVLSAVLGLSSTTFIGNALAGIALKLRGSFKPGDFITVNDIFGRVTEQGLFHTEVQTINRDLTSLPNMSLASNAVQVTRSSGTFISVECSLGYDVNRLKIEEAMLKGAKDASLEDPFVHIISMGDFSIVYRVHGLLKDVKSIVSAKSRLAGSVIDALHAAQIEIVSPTFMNQKQIGETIYIPKKYIAKDRGVIEENTPEYVIFDKAEEAENIEKRKVIVAELDEKLRLEKEKLKKADNETDKSNLQDKIKKTTELKNKLMDKIDVRMEELDKTK